MINNPPPLYTTNHPHTNTNTDTSSNQLTSKTVYYEPTGTVSKYQDATGNTSTVVRNLRPVGRY